MEDKLFLTLNEFANSIGITRQTASTMINNDEVCSFKRNRAFKIPVCSMKIAELLKNKKNKQFITTITNNKGGVCKTTSAINLATSYAFYGFTVLLVDLDIQANASSINDEDTSPKNNFIEKNITRLLLNMENMEDEEISKELSETIVNVKNEIFTTGSLDLLPNHFTMGADSEMFVTRVGAENLLDRLFKTLKKKYDIIIIDNSPKLDVMWRMSVMASNSILINVKPDKFSSDGLSGVFKTIKKINGAYKDRHNKNINTLGVITSAFDKGTNSDNFGSELIAHALKEHDIKQLEPFISKTIKANDSQIFGGSVMFQDPISKMSGEYLLLAYNIYLHFLETTREE